MSEKNDKKNTKAADTDKIDINKSVFQVKKDIRKQRDEETARQQLEMAQKIADREKEKRDWKKRRAPRLLERRLIGAHRCLAK